MDATIKDSGERQSFATGAVRDTADGKARYDLISPFALERLAHWLRLGAGKYGDRNWEKGMPLSRYLASGLRHLMAFHQGADDEDHVAAVLFNVMAIADHQAKIGLGILPAELDDLPHYLAYREDVPFGPDPMAEAIGDATVAEMHVPDVDVFDDWQTTRCTRCGRPVAFSTLGYSVFIGSRRFCAECFERTMDEPSRTVAASPPVLYVAGPMRGLAQFNFANFDKASAALRAAGFQAVNPADMDRRAGFDGTDAIDITQELRREFMRRDCNAICDCDGVALLDGWERSSGAAVEKTLAEFIGMRVWPVSEWLDMAGCEPIDTTPVPVTPTQED